MTRFGDEKTDNIVAKWNSLAAEYQIPMSIGNPNGVDVNLNNITFLAWVSERYQGTPARPILNACELEYIQGSNEPIYPIVAISAPESQSAVPTIKISIKTTNNTAQYEKTEDSPIYVLAENNIDIISISSADIFVVLLKNICS